MVPSKLDKELRQILAFLQTLLSFVFRQFANILENEELRQGIKAFSDWPTIPQLYIKGEFLGGSDIVKEMYESGELQKKLSEKSINYKKK